ncbi:MAG: YopX family protein [Clostridiaceae bacterium]|nr:YopX family protein [Clostridiaceae bacterium]
MDREILFRAWDTVRKEYLSAGEYFIGIQPGEYPETTKTYLDVLKDPDMYKTRFVVEPFTGLTDKNGKQIFEGDIVHTDDNEALCRRWSHENQFTIAEVCFDNVTGGYEPFASYDSDCGDYNDSTYFEVIGNVHDNPELLNNIQEEER